VIERRPLIEWAKAYVGDPESFDKRAEIMASFLLEEGMTPGETRVLEIGCGALNLPARILPECGAFVGIEPNGWLVEAGADWYGISDQITVLYRDDFLAAGQDHFDLAIAHSILSHVADWQLEQCLANVRKVMKPGGVFLASIRIDQYDKGARRWMYPDVSYFRLETVITLGRHLGWHVHLRHDLRERMIAACPNDVHDWLRLTAIPSAEEFNAIRVDEEARQREEREILEIAEAEYRRRAAARLVELERV
jgi:SAM-dependent methyltransferase